MRLEQSFEVPVPIAQAWNVLLDVDRIAPCMPGATLTDFDGESFAGVVKVKLGPVNLSYRGNGRFVERDEPGRRVVITASGQDTRGAGGASARITSILHDSDGGGATRVEVVADLDIAGRAAQFGRGMIGDVSNKLIKQFADCLAQTIAAERAPAAAPPAAPAPAAPPVPGAPAAPPVQIEPIPAAEPMAPAGPTAAEPAPTPSAEPAPTPVARPRPTPVEAEPIDLLAVTGVKGMVRRAAPYLIILAILIAALVVWLVVS